MQNVTQHPLYSVWADLKQRCYNPRYHQFADYGGRGIVVCERWLNSFQAFIDDMGPKPTPAHTIDRENNNGNYEPNNCRWATRREQLLNRRNTRRVIVQGREYLLAELVEHGGGRISRNAIDERAKQGLSLAEILNPKKRGNIAFLDKARAAATAKKLSATHCKRGHSLSGDNLRINPNGARVCRACSRLRDRNYRDTGAGQKGLSI